MRTTSRITRIGGSFYLHIPMSMINLLNLEKGNIVEFDITKLYNIDNDINNIKTFRCTSCQAQRDINIKEDDIYCTSCGCEDMTECEESDIKKLEELENAKL